jgi:hypothetical protein
MRIYFTTVRRGSSIKLGGELVRLNWATKQVEAATPIVPTNPTLIDPNPRGNTRGGRGIVRVGDDLIAASYHTLKVFTPELKLKRDVSHLLFAGLHELHATKAGTVWVTATAIDAALEVDPATGTVVRECWPRDDSTFRERWSLQPLSIDKSADNRGQFLAREHMTHPSHLHLNAVAVWNGQVYALFNSFGAIANLDTSEVVIEDPSLRGAHNLLIEQNGTAFVDDTINRNVRVFDLPSRRERCKIDLTTFPAVQAIKRQSWFADVVTRGLKQLGLKSPLARPLFVRGIDRLDDNLFVGFSPATIVCIDRNRMQLVDLYQHSRDVGECIHGVHVWQD